MRRIRTQKLIRIGLFLLILLTLWAILDRTGGPGRIPVGRDEAAHATFLYLLTVMTTLSVPRVHPLAIGAAFLALGFGVELGQGMGLLSGEAERGDLVADLVGVLAALLPMAVPSARRALRAEEAARAAAAMPHATAGAAPDPSPHG